MDPSIGSNLSTIVSDLLCGSTSRLADKMSSSPNLRRFCLSDPAESVSIVPKDSFVCLITQGHGTDLPILKELLTTISILHWNDRFRYEGIEGAKGLGKRWLYRDTDCGTSVTHWIGDSTNHQTEIAISIIAEMLQVRDQTSIQR